MSIPQVDRSIAHVDRAVIPASPAVVFERIVDLADVLQGRQDVRIDAWPAEGLRGEEATFWAGHKPVPTAGHAVRYDVTQLEAPNLVDLRATCDLYEAHHRVLVAPASGGGTEVSWTVALAPDQPATQQLLEDASLLATVTLQGLDTDHPVAPEPVAAGGATDPVPTTTVAAEAL